MANELESRIGDLEEHMSNLLKDAERKNALLDRALSDPDVLASLLALDVVELLIAEGAVSRPKVTTLLQKYVDEAAKNPLVAAVWKDAAARLLVSVRGN